MDTSVADRRSVGCIEADLLLARYRELVAVHPHLHAPEAAARLGVSEAALVAARVGHGAEWLQPDLSTLLAPLADWGKVLVASRLGLGVALSILHGNRVSTDSGIIRIESGQHDIRIRTTCVDCCALLDDHDAHGHTFSLNWFNSSGDAIGRVFLFSKTERKPALAHLRAQRIEGSGRSWAASDHGPPAGSTASGFEPIEAESSTIVAAGRTAGVIAGHALRHAALLPAVRLTCTTGSVLQRYTGPLTKITGEWPALHATEAGIKLHTHLQHTTRAERCVGTDGQPWLRFCDTEGSTLDICPAGSVTSAATWVSHLLAMECAP